MKAADGLFLKACQSVATEFPDITFDDVSLDNACLHVCIFDTKSCLVVIDCSRS